MPEIKTAGTHRRRKREHSMEFEYLVRTIPFSFIKWPLGHFSVDRSISGAGGQGNSGTSPLNLVFIVGFALLISGLAFGVARRGGKK